MVAKSTRQSRLGLEDVDFYTVGYERLALDELFALLKDNDVRCLVDIREAPWSRVPDYREAVLEDRLVGLSVASGYNIKYISMPELGNPPENRKSDRSAADMSAVYRQHALSHERELDELRDIIKSCKSALMCYEADPGCCHRSELAAIMKERYGLTCVDLRK